MSLETEMRAGLDACVHCGFCLPACPTYLAVEDENDSPRGRLVLMRAMLEGELAPDDATAAQHLDQCLGCRGCETACPSGVPYGHLLESTRTRMTEARPLPIVARIVLGVFKREWMLRTAMGAARVVRALGLAHLAARVLPRRLAFPAAMLASTRRTTGAAAAPTPTGNGSRESVAVLTGCVMEGLLAPINRATEQQLAAHDYRVVAAPAQRCCGALHAHAGDAASARELAKANIAAFAASGAQRIAVNSAGCGAMCKEYGHLLADDPAWATRAAAFSARVHDIHELIAASTATPAPSRSSVPAVVQAVAVAYDAPCHLQHAQRVVEQPLALLRRIPGVALVPLEGSDQCCGSAGIYSLLQPGISERVLEPKLRAIAASGAEVLATANPGCLMQMGAGLALAGSPVRVRHTVELLANAGQRVID